MKPATPNNRTAEAAVLAQWPDAVVERFSTTGVRARVMWLHILVARQHRAPVWLARLSDPEGEGRSVCAEHADPAKAINMARREFVAAGKSQ